MKFPIVFLIAFFATVSIQAADFQWEEYLEGIRVNDIVIEGDIIWCATEGHGALRFDSITGEYSVIAGNDSLAGDPLLSVAIDSSGVKWFGGQTMLYGYTNEIGKIYTNNNLPLPDRFDGDELLSVNDIDCDSKNVLWVKLWGRYLYTLTGDTWKRQLCCIENTISIDDHDRVWAGSLNIIAVYDGNEWKTHDFEDGDENFELEFDSRGDAWMITSEGLKFLRNGEWTTLHFQHKDRYRGGEAIAIDANDVVWLGTGYGLFSYEGTRLERHWGDYLPYDTTHRLHHEIVPVINDLKIATDGSIWAATDNGLVRYLFPAVPVEEEQPALFRDVRAWPNPFNTGVTIDFSLDSAETIRVDVYDSVGRKVKRLASGKAAAGFHTLFWDGLNESGFGVSSGLYFVRLSSERYETIKKILLVR